MCHPKHVEQLRNIGIVNSTTRLHLVGSFYKIYITMHGSMNINSTASYSYSLIHVCLKLTLCVELFCKFWHFIFHYLRHDGQTSFPFCAQTKHFIVLVLEMTTFATNETFSGVVHIYKLLTLLPPPSHICFQGPELSCSIAIICFVIVFSQR